MELYATPATRPLGEGRGLGAEVVQTNGQELQNSQEDGLSDDQGGNSEPNRGRQEEPLV